MTRWRWPSRKRPASPWLQDTQHEPELRALESKVRALTKAIDVPEAQQLPTFGHTEDGALPAIFCTERGFEWVIVERGREFERKVAIDEDEILYWTCAHVTRAMAQTWEVAHRVCTEDSRRGWLLKQVELLERLDPRWADRLRVEYEWLFTELGLSEG